jgi:hypothetical protein
MRTATLAVPATLLAILAMAGSALAFTNVTVLGESGQPVKGARLTLPDGKEVGTTDDRGQARLELGAGTHTIVVESGKTRVERQYTEPPGGAGNVTWQIPASAAAPQPSPDRFSLEGFGGAAFFDLPTIEYGTLVTSSIIGTEEKILRSEDSPTGWLAGFDFEFPITPNGALTGQIRYERTETDASRSIPVGGSPVAQVYFDRAPNEATAVGLGATGADVTIDTTFSRFAVYVEYMHDMNHCFKLDSSPLHVKAGGGLAYFRSWLSHDARQTSPTFSGIFSDAQIDSTTNIVGPNLGLALEYRLAKFSFELETHLLPGVAFGSGTAEQDNRCNLCASAQQAFTVKREQERSDFGLVTGLTARLAYSVTDRLQIGLTGGYDYTNTLYTWKIPVSPVEQPAKLDRKSTSTGFAGVSLRWSF